MHRTRRRPDYQSPPQGLRSQNEIQSEYASLDDFLIRWNSARKEAGAHQTSWKAAALCWTTSPPERWQGTAATSNLIATLPGASLSPDRAGQHESKMAFAKYGEQRTRAGARGFGWHRPNAPMKTCKHSGSARFCDSTLQGPWKNAPVGNHQLTSLVAKTSFDSAISGAGARTYLNRDGIGMRSSVSGIIKSIQDIMRKDVGVDGDAPAHQIGLVWMFFPRVGR